MCDNKTLNNKISILFDVDDTLYDQFDIFKNSYNEFFGAKYDIEIEELYNKSRYYSEKIFRLVEKNKKTLEDLYIYRLKKPFDDFGYNISEDDALNFQYIYSKNQNNMKISENIKKVIEFCKDKKVKLGIITNGISKAQWEKIEKLRVLNWIEKEYIFVSEDVGYSKPDINIFKYVEKNMNLDKKCTYYIGDSLNNDVIGVENVGWNMIWLNKRNINIDNINVSCKYIINSDSELLSIIEKILAPVM